MAALYVYGLLVLAATVRMEESDADDEFSEEDALDRLGPAPAQVYSFPFAASFHLNGTFVCSAVVLNQHWLVTVSKCFDVSHTSTRLVKRNLTAYSVRVGSSYNSKGGDVHEISNLVNNFELKVTAVRVRSPLALSSRVQAAALPAAGDRLQLGYLATMLAWTPNQHLRIVNAPVVDANICEGNTKLPTGKFVCVSGVQDPNRGYCRKDNGGAVIQNSTLIALTSFVGPCALYSRPHAFPKISPVARWLDGVVWSDTTRATTATPPTTTTTTAPTTAPTTARPRARFADKYPLRFPFNPLSLPLEPAGGSVLPRVSLYESYLQNIARVRKPPPTTASTTAPSTGPAAPAGRAAPAPAPAPALRQNLVDGKDAEQGKGSDYDYI